MRLQKRCVQGVSFPSLWPRSAWPSCSFLSAAVIVSGLLAAGKIYANPIEINLAPPHNVTSHLSIPFDALNDTVVGGETMSFDLAITNNDFVRLFTVTSSLFEASITLHTNGTSKHDFLQGTGFLIDSQGMPIPGFGVTGSASGHDWLNIGFFPLLKDENGTPNTDLPRPLDFFGIHFDLTFPDKDNPAVQVIGGEFGLFSNPGAGFGVGPGIPQDIVPDAGDTLLLLAISLTGLMGARIWGTSVG